LPRPSTDFEEINSRILRVLAALKDLWGFEDGPSPPLAAGSIVNVSSDASFLGVVDHAAHCASKAALDGLSRVTAVELGRSLPPLTLASRRRKPKPSERLRKLANFGNIK
jgi:short subunit dehydrogenase